MSRSQRDILIGADPFDIEALWRRMYNTCMHGRRGAVIHQQILPRIAFSLVARFLSAGLDCSSKLGG